MLRFRSLAGLSLIALPAASLAASERAGGPLSATRPAAQQTGRQIFESVCAACHTVQPPAKLAPPMSHIARHYREALPEHDEAVARIAAWVRQPAADRSLLEAHAIEMWGVMPPLQLAEDQARTVAGYVLSLADSATGGGMMGRGRGMMGADTAMAGHRGMGMGMGRGMMHMDTSATAGRGRGMMRRDTTALPHRHRGG